MRVYVQRRTSGLAADGGEREGKKSEISEFLETQ